MILRRKRLQRSSVPKRGGPLKRGKGVRRVSAKRPAVEKADAVWRRAVRERADNLCEWRFYGPACRGLLEAHHHYRKGSRPRLRHDLDNGILVCKRHHDWADEVEGRDHAPRWFDATHPERWARLQAKAARESRLLA